MDTSFDFKVNTEVHHYIYDSETKKIHMRSAKISKVFDTYVVLVYWNFRTKAWHTVAIRKAHILSGRIISRKGKFYLWSINMNDDAVKRQFWDYFWEKATTFQEKYIQNIQILTDFGNNVHQPEVKFPIEWKCFGPT